MKNEAQFKLAFKNSVRKQKGYSMSLAVPVFPGIPDLYTIMPNYMPVLIEAKWISTPNRFFNRKIEYTPKQLDYARKVNAVQPHAMMGLVGVRIEPTNTIYAVLTTINVDDPTENRMSDTFLHNKANKVARQDKLFDVLSLFRNSPIPLIEETKADFDVNRLGELTGCPDIIRGAPYPDCVSVSVSASSIAFMAVPRQTPS